MVLLADVAQLPPRPPPDAGLETVRTLGGAGTRFTAWRDGVALGYVEMDTGVTGAGRFTGQEGWADVGNLHVVDGYRRRGIATWLLGEAGEWLRLARVHRLLDYAAPDDAGYLAFLERMGFRRLTETVRQWELTA